MNLFSNTTEESNYKSIYNKIVSNTHLTKGTCIKLMVKRGQIPEETANKIWLKSSGKQNDSKLTQNQFFYLLRSVAAIQSGLKYDEIEDVWKLTDLKLPKFPKSDEMNQKNAEEVNQKTNKEKKSPQNNEKPLENVSSTSLHQEIYEKPKVYLLRDLEATVDLNREDASIHQPVEKLSTPSFTSSNPNISLDLDGFKLHTGEIMKDGIMDGEKEFKLNEDFNTKVSSNLSLLKSVNQMNLESKKIKFDFGKEVKKKKICKQVEITDYVFMKKGYLDNAYYIYRISSKFEDKGLVIVERRYSDFEWLHAYLNNHPKYQGLLIPKLPEKHGIGASLFNYLSSDVEFIKKRKNDLEGYLKEVLAHDILQSDETFEKFLCLNSNEFNTLKTQNDIYDQKTESGSFLKMPSPGNIKTFYQFYEHAQAYLYTKYNAVIRKKKSCVTEHVDSLVEGINIISNELKKIFDYFKKLHDLQKDNLNQMSLLKGAFESKSDQESHDFIALNKWGEYMSFCCANNEYQKDNHKSYTDNFLLQNVEILLKKIEVVNIAQGNLSNYIDNLDYAINLFENKRAGLMGNNSLNEEGSELKQLQYKINSLQESIKLIEANLTKELKIFQEKL